MALKERILEVVNEYIAADESYDDDAQLTIDPATKEVGLTDGEDAESLPETVDCYPAMDFVEMDAEGNWRPDMESIESVAADYGDTAD